jgi:hypothetical protein
MKNTPQRTPTNFKIHINTSLAPLLSLSHFFNLKYIPNALHLLYEETFLNDRALKDVAINFVASQAYLFSWTPFRELCLEISEIPVDMWLAQNNRGIGVRDDDRCTVYRD